MFNLFEKNLYKQILAHVHDPKTWRSFALTCKSFAAMCQAETPTRKVEFRISISNWMSGSTTQYIHIHAPSRFLEPLVLPNGSLHGTVKTGVDGVDRDDVGELRIVDTGDVQTIVRLDTEEVEPVHFLSPDFGKMFFVRHVLIVVISHRNRNVKGLSLYNLEKKTFIYGGFCPICSKIHSFRISGSNLCYERTCLETKYEIGVVTIEKMLKKDRREKMACKILHYAKFCKSFTRS
jgi:hypothetical protein